MESMEYVAIDKSKRCTSPQRFQLGSQPALTFILNHFEGYPQLCMLDPCKNIKA